MHVPDEFHQRLFQHISIELIRIDGPQNPTELAWSCGRFTRRWFGIDMNETEFEWKAGRELISWAERLGKSVGEFYYNQKEG